MNRHHPNDDNDNNNDEAAAPPPAIVPLLLDGVDNNEEEDNHNDNEDNFDPPVRPDEPSEDDGDDNDEDEDADAENERICNEAMAILLNRLSFPSPQRDRSIVRFAQQFINNVKEDIHKTITDTRLIDILGEGYDGLDSERDTEAEVETAIRCDPEVITRRHEHFEAYPIRCLTIMLNNDNTKIMCNVMAVSFVPLFARLAIEFQSFEEHERGGLLIEDERARNVFHFLTHSSTPLPAFNHNDHHEHVESLFLAVLIRLRQARLFTKNDIQQHRLVHELCKNKAFPNQRFRFMTEWCPSSLLQTDENGCLPLHWATFGIQNFRPVCDAVFRYYPKWKGIQLLYQKDTTLHGSTPFQLASQYLGHTVALTIVEETLARYSETVLPDIPKALILAASEERIHVECVYFLLKRQPDITISNLQQRYGRPHGAALLSTNNTRSRRCRNNNNINNRIIRRSTRKRKRN